jgi:hypothetical protein
MTRDSWHTGELIAWNVSFNTVLQIALKNHWYGTIDNRLSNKRYAEIAGDTGQQDG